MNSSFFNKIFTTKTGSWEVFSDLVALGGIFSCVVYLGGHLYLRTYFSHFSSILALRNWNFSDAAISFLNNIVLASPWITILTIVLLTVLAFLFYVSRVAFPSWLGYIVLCVSLLLLLIFSLIISKKYADINAEKDWILGETTLPSVSLDHFSTDNLDTQLREQLNKGTLLLLTEADNLVFLIEPYQRNGTRTSASAVYIIKASDIVDLKLFPSEK
jgi:hypothetical protein